MKSNHPTVLFRSLCALALMFMTHIAFASTGCLCINQAALDGFTSSTEIIGFQNTAADGLDI